MADDEEIEEEEDEEDEDDDSDAETDAEDGEGGGKKKGGKGKLIIIVVVVVLVVGGLGAKMTVFKKPPVPCTPRDELGLHDWMAATDFENYEKIVEEMEAAEAEKDSKKSEEKGEDSKKDEHGLGARPGKSLNTSGGEGGGGPHSAGDENAPAVQHELHALETAEDPPCKPLVIEEGAWFEVEGVVVNLERDGDFGSIDIGLRLPLAVTPKIAEEGGWDIPAKNIASKIYQKQPADLVSDATAREELDAEFKELVIEEYHGDVLDVRISKFVIQEA